MPNPNSQRSGGLTSVRDTLLSAALVGDLPFSRDLVPNPDALVPPGYFVAGADGRCGHCGAIEAAHLEAKRYCPLPPLEFRQCAA